MHTKAPMLPYQGGGGGTYFLKMQFLKIMNFVNKSTSTQSRLEIVCIWLAYNVR